MKYIAQLYSLSSVRGTAERYESSGSHLIVSDFNREEYVFSRDPINGNSVMLPQPLGKTVVLQKFTQKWVGNHFRILKKMTRRDILKAFGLLKKEGRHVFHPRVVYHRFKQLKIETPEPTAINIDGENIGSTPIRMEVLPSEIKIFY